MGISTYNLCREYGRLEIEKGYPLKALGFPGYALTKDLALKAIDIIKKIGIEILGGDVYSLRDGVLKNAGEGWYCLMRDYKNEKDYIENSWIIAENYIKSYPDLKDEVILFEIGLPSI